MCGCVRACLGTLPIIPVLSGNCIEAVPLKTLGKLEKVSLSHNQLREVPDTSVSVLLYVHASSMVWYSIWCCMCVLLDRCAVHLIDAYGCYAPMYSILIHRVILSSES